MSTDLLDKENISKDVITKENNLFKALKPFQYIILVAFILLAISKLIPHIGEFSQLALLKDSLRYGWLFLAVLAQISQYIGDGWLAKALTKIIGIELSIKDTFRIGALNVFAAHLLPVGEAGGIVASYHFYRKLGVSSENFIFLIVCWTFITYFLLGVLTIIPIFFLPELPISINSSVLTITLLISAIIIGGIYIGRKKIVEKLEKILGNYKWAKPVFEFIKNRKGYWKEFFKKPKIAGQALFACFLYYASNIATLAFSFMAFGMTPSLWLIIFAFAASTLFSKLTLAPAGLGASEATLILIFLEANIDPKISFAAIILYRLISFWLPIPGGFLAYYSLQKDLKRKQKI